MPKWKQHFDKHFPLYHVSDVDHDGEEFVPKSMDPNAVMEGENWRTKRICVAKDITGALTALNLDSYYCKGKTMYVHVPMNLDSLFENDKVFKPSTKQVPDQETTSEHWIKAKCVMKCIGTIKLDECYDGAGMPSKMFLDIDGNPQYLDYWAWHWTTKRN